MQYLILAPCFMQSWEFTTWLVHPDGWVQSGRDLLLCLLFVVLLIFGFVGGFGCVVVDCCFFA